MMHGTIASPRVDSDEVPVTARIRGAVRRSGALVVVVILPTLIVALYYLVFAAPQYISEAHFLVRSSEQNAVAPTGLGAVLSQAAGVSSTATETRSVSDYLDSHDAVATLRQNTGLVDIFNRPEADLLSRLGPADPTPERLLKYYRKQVKIGASNDSGIVDLTVRTFRPQDSLDVARALLELGEKRVNALNRRAYDDGLRESRRLLADSEAQLAAAERDVTTFRQTRGDIDPQGTGQSQTQLVTGLRGQLAQARAQLAGMNISPNAPQVVALRNRVRSLETQVAREGSRLTSGATSIASGLGDYQGLLLRQKFAATRYETAAAAVEKSREEARRQQLFIVRVVEPNLPVKSLYPTPFKNILTVFGTLLLAYALGWLIAAGMREHAN